MKKSEQIFIFLSQNINFAEDTDSHLALLYPTSTLKKGYIDG